MGVGLHCKYNALLRLRWYLFHSLVPKIFNPIRTSKSHQSALQQAPSYVKIQPINGGIFNGYWELSNINSLGITLKVVFMDTS